MTRGNIQTEVGQLEVKIIGWGDVSKTQAQFHPILKVVACESEKDGEKRKYVNSASKKMDDYLKEQAGQNNFKLDILHSQIKYLVHFTPLQVFFMEKFGGYKRI